MAWDNVPWFVGGGALHSPEVARLLAFAAFGGSEGIVQGGDLQVRALDVPTSKVRVLPGACAINSRASGGAQQAYAGRLPSEDVLDIAATGSSSGRSDLIIARVEDPFMPGEPWSNPADPGVGPYIFTRVISNVPNTATTLADAGRPGDSAIPLARIDIPANTSTITADMVKPLRAIAQPRRVRSHDRYDTGAGGSGSGGTLNTWVHFPNVPVAVTSVPPWATKVIMRCDVTGIQVQTGNLAGYFRFRLNTITGAGPEVNVETAASYVNEQTWGDNRHSYVVSSSADIPAAARGRGVQGIIEFYKTGGGGTFLSAADASVVVDIEFIEGPV